MKLSSRHRSASTRLELSMTGMIDVVFLLLIFFLVTAAYDRPEQRLASQIRMARMAAAGDDLEPLVIEIEPAAGGFVYRVGGLTTVEFAEVRQLVEGFSQVERGAIVRADDSAPFDLAAQAVALCRRRGFAHVTYQPRD